MAYYKKGIIPIIPEDVDPKKLYSGSGMFWTDEKKKTHKHKWIKKRYDGLSVIAEWEICTTCGKERNRKVTEK